MCRDLLLLLLLAGSGIALWINGRQLKPISSSHIAGIKSNPGIQMQFAKKSKDVTDLLGESGSESGKLNRLIMGHQQHLDFPFIVLYWAVFFFVIGEPLRSSGLPAARTLGQLVCISISIAAVADSLEDAGILFALSSTHQGVLWPFKFAVTKWLFTFLTLGLSGFFLLSYPKLAEFPVSVSKLTTVPARLAGFFFLAGALVGLIGLIGAFFQKVSLLTLGA